MENKPLASAIFSSSLLLSAVSGISAEEKTDKKMNIVIILADDLGWGDVGFHGSKIRTPCLDQLAAEGILLNRFYTAPVSSPTRAGLMTGCYPSRFGIRETVIPPWRDFGLEPEEDMLPEMLERAGYRNRAIVGKWHLGHSRKKYYPLSNGFTHFYGHLNGAIDYFTHEREKQLDWHRDWETSRDEGYSTDLITREAVDCIHSYSKEGAFFLYVAFNAPHGPLQAKPEDIALYTDSIDSLPPGEKKKALFAAMVTCMDRGIGQIRQALKDSKIEDNTLLIFFSDNGAEPNGGGSCLPLRGNKFQEWDGGVRVPAVVYCPGRFEGARQTDQLTGFVDIMPTIKGMLNMQEKPHRPFDGMDISPVLSGRTEMIERDFYLGCGALVNTHYKLILPGKNPRMNITGDYLVHYPGDPYESENAADKYPAETKRMKAIAEACDAIKPPFKVEPYDKGRKGFVAPFEWKIEQ